MPKPSKGSTPRSPNAEMPFLDHLEELRWRIIWSLLAVAVTVGLSFWALIQFDVIKILAHPILPYLPPGQKLVYTHPTDSFMIYMTLSIVLGVVAALPVVVYQAWAFLSPALYKNEKKLVVPVAIGAAILFICGVTLCYFGVMPLALDWLLHFQSESLQPMISVKEYFDFLFTMSLAFGIAFELPIVILVLTALGLVTPMFLRKYRRHAIVLCVFVGAFLTPGDLVWTTLAMAVPLYVLYELSIVLSAIVYRRQQKSEDDMEQKRLLPA